MAITPLLGYAFLPSLTIPETFNRINRMQDFIADQLTRALSPHDRDNLSEIMRPFLNTHQSRPLRRIVSAEELRRTAVQIVPQYIDINSFQHLFALVFHCYVLMMKAVKPDYLPPCPIDDFIRRLNRYLFLTIIRSQRRLFGEETASSDAILEIPLPMILAHIFDLIGIVVSPDRQIVIYPDILPEQHPGLRTHTHMGAIEFGNLYYFSTDIARYVEPVAYQRLHLYGSSVFLTTHTSTFSLFQDGLAVARLMEPYENEESEDDYSHL